MKRQQAAKQGDDLVLPDVAGTDVRNVYEHQRGQEERYGSGDVQFYVSVYGQSHIADQQNGICKKQKI